MTWWYRSVYFLWDSYFFPPFLCPLAPFLLSSPSLSFSRFLPYSCPLTITSIWEPILCMTLFQTTKRFKRNRRHDSHLPKSSKFQKIFLKHHLDMYYLSVVLAVFIYSGQLLILHSSFFVFLPHHPCFFINRLVTVKTSLSGCGDHCNLCMILKIWVHETKITHHPANVLHALFLNTLHFEILWSFRTAFICMLTMYSVHLKF